MEDKTVRCYDGDDVRFLSASLVPQYPNQEALGLGLSAETQGKPVFERFSSVDRFRKITEYMGDLYEKKNQDYGNAFEESVDDLGAIAGLVPIRHKFVRLKNLIKGSLNQLILKASTILCWIWLTTALCYIWQSINKNGQPSRLPIT